MAKKNENLEAVLENIKEGIESIRYGTITIIIQDGVVIQLEKNEKIRLR